MSRNYRSFSNHVRHNQADPLHAELREKWWSWRRSGYVGSLRCRKCGETWEILDRSRKDEKNCPTCRSLKTTLGKKAYEAMPTIASTATPKAQSSKPPAPKPLWVAGDPVYSEVVDQLNRGVKVATIMTSAGLPYAEVRAIGRLAMGDSGYRDLMLQRKKETGSKNVRKSHAKYNRLSPEEKAALLKSRFGGTCALEAGFAAQLQRLGVPFSMNEWQALLIEGRQQPREADIKVDLGSGSKIVIFCDGEAFHGPGTIHGSPLERIALDSQTARAYFSIGYSSLRYSESEIHSGDALTHLRVCLERLQKDQSLRIYRNWCPLEEEYVQGT